MVETDKSMPIGTALWKLLVRTISCVVVGLKICRRQVRLAQQTITAVSAAYTADCMMETISIAASQAQPLSAAMHVFYHHEPFRIAEWVADLLLHDVNVMSVSQSTVSCNSSEPVSEEWNAQEDSGCLKSAKTALIKSFKAVLAADVLQNGLFLQCSLCPLDCVYMRCRHAPGLVPVSRSPSQGSWNLSPILRIAAGLHTSLLSLVQAIAFSYVLQARPCSPSAGSRCGDPGSGQGGACLSPSGWQQCMQCGLLLAVHAVDRFVRCRHAFGDQYMATDIKIPQAGKLELVFHPQDGGEAQRYPVHEFDGAGKFTPEWPRILPFHCRLFYACIQRHILGNRHEHPCVRQARACVPT